MSIENKTMDEKITAKILLVEDNRDIAYGLKNNLEFEEHTVTVAGDGREGLELMSEFQPDLVVLDLMLPGMGGYEFLAEIRDRGDRTPVLILSARGEELDKVRGFRLGADDYVTKPFGTMELIARISAILRRSSPIRAEKKLWRFGNVVVDPNRRIVQKKDKNIQLSPLEYELLITLLKREGSVASRNDLLEEVWQHSGDVVTRTVDTHIAELRRKLEDEPSDPEFIKTVPKVGYRLEV